MLDKLIKEASKYGQLSITTCSNGIYLVSIKVDKNASMCVSDADLTKALEQCLKDVVAFIAKMKCISCIDTIDLLDL